MRRLDSLYIEIEDLDHVPDNIKEFPTGLLMYNKQLDDYGMISEGENGNFSWIHCPIYNPGCDEDYLTNEDIVSNYNKNVVKEFIYSELQFDMAIPYAQIYATLVFAWLYQMEDYQITRIVLDNRDVFITVRHRVYEIQITLRNTGVIQIDMIHLPSSSTHVRFISTNVHVDYFIGTENEQKAYPSEFQYETALIRDYQKLMGISVEPEITKIGPNIKYWPE
jgi:hypothetical protein